MIFAHDLFTAHNIPLLSSLQDCVTTHCIKVHENLGWCSLNPAEAQRSALLGERRLAVLMSVIVGLSGAQSRLFSWAGPGLMNVSHGSFPIEKLNDKMEKRALLVTEVSNI